MTVDLRKISFGRSPCRTPIVHKHHRISASCKMFLTNRKICVIIISLDRYGEIPKRPKVVVDTEVYTPKLSDFYLTQKRDKYGNFTK